MATKAKTKAKTKKHALKNTFLGVHGVCPELVNLFDYMVDQSTHGSRDVTLRDVEGYVENMIDAITSVDRHLRSRHRAGRNRTHGRNRRPLLLT